MNNYVNDFNETVGFYYKELKSCKPLSREEEMECILKAKKGDIIARNKVLKANLRFVFDIAKVYKGSSVSIDDLIAEGNMGMIKAIDKFDVDFGTKFISYAVWWIRQYMQALIQKTQTSKSIEKSDEINFPNDNVGILFDNEDEVVNKREMIMSNEDEEEKNEIESNHRAVVENLLVKLDDRERIIVENYYGLNELEEKNLEEIGDMLGISKERVRQVKLTALRKMRSEILLMEHVKI